MQVLIDAINWSLVIDFAIIMVKIMVLVGVLFSLPMPLTWIERKVAGHIHARLGPFRVGPHGILQPLADTIKMLVKEILIPTKADKLIFIIAPFMAMVPIMMAMAVVPFGENVTIPFINKEITLSVSNMNVGVIYVLALSGLAVYGIIFGGWASNSKYALLGGLRSTAQMISYEVAMTFAVVGVVMLTNTLNLGDIVRAQGGGFWNWNVFYLPVGPIWFFIFLVAGIAEMNRIPFDLPEDEGVLAAGYNVEYSGMLFSFFMLAEYVALFSVSVFSVLFFFGGWQDPFAGILNFPIPIPPVFWFFVKIAAFIYFFMWLRFTIPRYRYDQLMTIGWKILIPLSLVTLLVTGIMRIYLS
ncbi:MAG: NADH-quinone oxidoreductase subunit NuoH [Deltaproteobacteria bacterium]|nr:NADH-quinone oxidoreductase subunit NuoH [Deltaproteobacteria bacterium]